MSLNVIDLIKGQLGPSVTANLSTDLGESEAGIQKAISGLLPVVLGGIINHADDREVTMAISNASVGNETLSSPDSVTSGIPAKIFGDKSSSIASTIATYAGISSNSAGTLLSMVTTAATAAIGKYANDQQLDHDGISQVLKDQKDEVSNLMPAGLSLASLANSDWAKGYRFDEPKQTVTKHDEPIEVTRSTADNGTFPDRELKEDKSIWKWLLPLLLLLAAAYFVYTKYTKKETTVTTTVVDSTGVIQDTTVIMNSPAR
ncbi:hypothetical protein ASG01_09560 [Chryseobacterium sp. Leaf180]|uniref:DUF937 domain-containing protein n=1 Tax=Chryseobacterium sp. Leaf180 TaxID=1736289 RepID=UPI0006FE59EB|nr:DUF937 domain-containing protein [Chryseobacterium sp. Leaf180]KQR93423.1 hypothetical protein ASG01_09560 [Chryseobacterium sp. Leaf180]